MYDGKQEKPFPRRPLQEFYINFKARRYYLDSFEKPNLTVTIAGHCKNFSINPFFQNGNRISFTVFRETVLLTATVPKPDTILSHKLPFSNLALLTVNRIAAKAPKYLVSVFLEIFEPAAKKKDGFLLSICLIHLSSTHFLVKKTALRKKAEVDLGRTEPVSNVFKNSIFKTKLLDIIIMSCK